MKSIDNLPKKMKALVFVEKGKIEIVEKDLPKVGPNDALIKVTTTTICGTDIHIWKGEYPVVKGLTLGHEAIGTLAAYGDEVKGYELNERVLAGAITPSGHSAACQGGQSSQDGDSEKYGYKLTAGWKFGNIADGCQAEYILVKDAMYNLAKVPSSLTDEQVLMCPDIMSTGFSGAENARIKIGDFVGVIAQGPIGLCATNGARLLGASKIIAIDGNDSRLEMAKKMGATHTINFTKEDVLKRVSEITDGRMLDSAIECLGKQATFNQAVNLIRPGGTVSSLGVYSEDISIPIKAIGAGLNDGVIAFSLCPGGKERMRRLMEIIETNRVDLTKLVTHTMPFDKIVEAYDLFANQRDGVLKVALKF
ncbi:zinc-binding dehydrogenase [Mycoplasma bradburyae]|uniref:Zinc-binding dehydrogenase n=2 Tax=Mycoplasma bradburyae TaxID=2963128 RepID=A0AAW6HR00_9MOLU|nr:zinc-binding dehydrogenase [Mycoplasma bradburyae]MDC4163484.1 zinc-binding dehydrogenase [Mycoplasma bradburyae]MDC4182086.1 zinc-binding dehydrogenase [Mycoplasma bradburyae]MDC4182858.1 zinc-binding dehydrogenase [Mycoplasma bradburyae]MDC4183533.1 zinc-binding dehydrogenase [Mycoplasma bradburyae]MDC4184272.1 zinc-binding dehydrogenase [Mycoplasma bradburyae]